MPGYGLLCIYSHLKKLELLIIIRKRIFIVSGVILRIHCSSSEAMYTPSISLATLFSPIPYDGREARRLRDRDLREGLGV